MAQQKSAVRKKQHSDKDEEICRHQLSPPATTSHCPVTYMLPSTFLSIAVARAMAVLVAVVVAVDGIVVAVRWRRQWRWHWRWRWQWW